MRFCDFLALHRLNLPVIEIVDIGANPLAGKPPYQTLLDSSSARLIGFEPDPEPFAKLQMARGPLETYLPHAVGDGRRHTLRICSMSGMNSLLEPNLRLLDLLHFHGAWARVVRSVEVDTRRLDDIREVDAMDYLKIDIQGGELMVFQNAPAKLRDCLVVHTEVMFVPMYVDQPLYAEQAGHLARFGLVTHKFFDLIGHALKPFSVNGDGHAPLSQLFWADVVFIKDFTRLDALRPEQLLKLAAILHDVYGSIDVVHLVLTAHDRGTGSAIAQPYAELVTQGHGAAAIPPGGS